MVEREVGRLAFVNCYSRGATAPPGNFAAQHGIVRRASRCKRRSTLKYPFHKRFTPVQYCFNHYVSSVKINQFLHSQVSWIFLSTFSLKRARCPNFYSTRRRSAVFSMLESRAIEVYIRHGYTAWRDVMWHFLSLIITSLSICHCLAIPLYNICLILIFNFESCIYMCWWWHC